MKVALSTKNNMVTEHFGHCDYFIVYEIENKEIIGSFLIKNPPHQKGHLPKFLKENGIDVVIAGGIGAMAVNLLEELNIQVIMNVCGHADEVIKKYINNELKSNGEPCSDHHH
ncbi:MAG: NifB/NifX family molybdenum-iron cluster-binding protein [Candidatus Izemoplasmatales bacterium]|uniref:Dinitrogenase iron-molybdenum cofactor n=1 Tax=Hujiaoplasma nucleasis TaxID=2725268 RepID=A0A7L6N438_9MOLU|nr:NifB/NifX family molybdenum-iron cluster-binding protein [Hujiaoplasma nucleasis]QLY39339.1 dinitrogenase iron-molybdenum cofactor [Hujiaoplasma nucleasis]